MKTNIPLALHCATLAFLLNVVCVLIGQPAQAQIIQQRRIPLPQVQEAARKGFILAQTAAASLHAGNYAQAETEARQAISVEILPGVGEEVLAAALNAQGKNQEALQAYHIIVVDEKDDRTRNLLPYALLLLRSGKWEQAVAAYAQALPHLGDADLIRANSHFSPTVPEPAALAIAIHIAQGLTYNGECDWAGEPQHIEALAEYAKALQLAPNSDLANYYYGYGWQRLDLKDRARIGNVQLAKSSLQKAILLGKTDVKKAARKVLDDLNKPADKPA